MPSYAVGLFLATVERTACLGEENAHGFDIQSVVSFCLLGLLAGPASAQDAISKAEQVDGNLRPLEAGEIAEEGFVYGLPLVMSYAIMYAYTMDKNSGAYTAPINQLFNEAQGNDKEANWLPSPDRSTCCCVCTCQT